VVTTSAGNSGVTGVSGTHLWVADRPEEFARHVAALLEGRDWDKLSGAGRQLVAERFSWERSVVELERVLDPLAAMQRNPLAASQ